MRKYIGISLLTLAFVGCSPLQKALKSDDLEQRKELANKYFQEKKYRKAIRLYESIEKDFKARPDAEQMYYQFAEATFQTDEFMLAAERFKIFASTYPRSDKREEALLKEIKSGVELSPVYSLDQTITVATIGKLQKFIDQYPNSEFVPEANKIMADLNTKLEMKAFENAKQLNTIGDFTRNYGAAIVALDNFIYEYPGTSFKEEALFYKLDSAYKLAMNSVHYKMEERLINAIGMYDALMRFNSTTEYKEKADKMLADINKELQNFSK